MVTKKSFGKYLLYGIGEIILVVIGILIAVSINNYNEKKASKNQLESYLQVYKQDLEVDTLVVGQVLKYLDERKAHFQLFLGDSVSAKTYQENPEGYGIILSYFPFKLQQKGMGLLEKYVNDTEIEQDTLISNILATHRFHENLIKETVDRVSDDIDNNLTYFKEEQPWIGDLLTGKIDHPDMMPYLLSQNYKARLAVHSTFVYGNLEPQLKAIQSFNKKTISELNERLKQE
ncbi:DUF6090 family protein [Psychroserpens ponticola]|uniref:DUF6090 family protein n=1 Tax=Psychroserpens ponticola TaxID=2932268 RepID=A0ABY7S1C4_9FLAO|nr:DUF6090 family protein [Psychroserpens ponticola]WCO03194.1 DUF6090 family protein [Psychroserpens ponticola]